MDLATIMIGRIQGIVATGKDQDQGKDNQLMIMTDIMTNKEVEKIIIVIKLIAMIVIDETMNKIGKEVVINLHILHIIVRIIWGKKDIITIVDHHLHNIMTPITETIKIIMVTEVDHLLLITVEVLHHLLRQEVVIMINHMVMAVIITIIDQILMVVLPQCIIHHIHLIIIEILTKGEDQVDLDTKECHLQDNNKQDLKKTAWLKDEVIQEMKGTKKFLLVDFQET